MELSVNVSESSKPPAKAEAEIVCIFLLCVILIKFLQHHYHSEHRQAKLHPPVPPGPKGWPIVGNLTQLGPSPHVTLTHWRAQYGDVYSLQLGSWPAVVISGLPTIREALVKKADAFSSRPDFPTFKYYANGKSVSFSPYHHGFKTHRGITARALTKLLSDKSILETTILREANNLIESLLQEELPTDPTRAVTSAVAAILFSVCFGPDADIREDEELCNLLTGINPATELFGVGNQVDLMPWIRHFTRSTLHQENIQHMTKLVEVLKGRINEHTTEFRRDTHGVIDLMMNQIRDLEDDKVMGLTEEHLLGTAVEFLSAGSDTSSTTLSWLILYMAGHPEAQDKVFHEIDDVVSCGQPVTSSIRHQLPFTECCMLEVMRLTTIVPFGLPHYTSRSTTLNGYSIRKDTLVFVNLWSISREGQIWDNPDEFQPERFLDDGVVDRHVAAQFLPFGTGRRRCIGERLGRLQIFLIFVSIMHKCRFVIPPGEHPDMGPVFGDIMKPRPFTVQIVMRQ